MTFALWDVLDSLNTLERATPAQIAEHTGRDRGDVIRLLHRALEVGLVSREETWTIERRRTHAYWLTGELPPEPDDHG